MSKAAGKSKTAPGKLSAKGAVKKKVTKTSPKGLLKKTPTKTATNGHGIAQLRLPMAPLEAGQIWQMKELNLQVGLVGKLLVHYKLAKPDAVRVANSVGGRTTVEKYLKTNKAVLIGLDKVAAAKANKI
jgi:hypothetical protein